MEKVWGRRGQAGASDTRQGREGLEAGGVGSGKPWRARVPNRWGPQSVLRGEGLPGGAVKSLGGGASKVQTQGLSAGISKLRTS